MDGRTDGWMDGLTDDQGHNTIQPLGRIQRRNCLLQAISPFLTMFSTAI